MSYNEDECGLGGECPCAHHYGQHGSDLDDARNERDELRKLLLAVVEEAEHGWHYASDYFREKWRDGELLDRARKAGITSVG